MAYADELMASELKIGSASFLDSRSPISYSFARGRPNTACLTRDSAAPSGVVGRDAAGLATSWPGPV